MPFVRNILGRHDGAVYVWLVILLPVYILLLGFVADLGLLYSLSNRVQMAMDTSATSALAASVKIDSLRHNNGSIEVDTTLAKNKFHELLGANLSARFENGSIKLKNAVIEPVAIKVEASGPPKIAAKYKVKYDTFILNKIGHSCFYVETESILAN